MWCTTRFILGPLFFLLYINDLPHCLNKTKPRLFADDTNLTASANSMTDLETSVNSDLENLRKSVLNVINSCRPLSSLSVKSCC